jgi:hypothetical protein
MKKIYVLGLTIFMGTTLFAQQFFIDGHIASDFESITPNIGFGVALNPVDILAGVNFSFTSDKYEYEPTYFNFNAAAPSKSFGFYAGVAPKANITEKINISFPILVQGRFWGSETKYDKNFISVSAGDLKKNDAYSVIASIGARANYSFTASWGWGIFAGFGFNVFSYTEYKNERYLTTSQTGGTYSRTEKVSKWFDGGDISLGVCYKFKKL